MLDVRARCIAQAYVLAVITDDAARAERLLQQLDEDERHALHRDLQRATDLAGRYRWAHDVERRK